MIVRKETLKEPMLNVYLQNKISGIHIMNMAVSGNNSQALRERFAKDVLSYTADKVFILIGTNDLAEHKQLSKETYQKICSG
ncbi:SGNH/GDSL hydrolase family protein [Enterococcus faecium]|uniref:SGNH/GDSL hydrolase family protein n=1 Tax=Enterococcus faecium TaxID=1352 RepID=UPI00103865EE|nr:SGNH/GDSL hydrolase family protein [Enterococcus faecium]MCO5417997.1 SGNH/GDSL hydrolase family protein [Enterococcus faecium]NRE79548.1 SGNH/GDSL hydrolase family protein [Enterococcus faecium]NTR34324.1 SGNH/GDSL hydrolase family protein [Enterococcus faecium]